MKFPSRHFQRTLTRNSSRIYRNAGCFGVVKVDTRVQMAYEIRLCNLLYNRIILYNLPYNLLCNRWTVRSMIRETIRKINASVHLSIINAESNRQLQFVTINQVIGSEGY